MGHKAPEESEGVLLEKENRKQKDRATPRGRLEERFVRLVLSTPRLKTETKRRGPEEVPSKTT